MPRAQVALTPDAHRALVSITAQVTGMLERRVTQSEAMLAMIAVARAHPDELLAAAKSVEGKVT
jgi:hypothetical protein